MPKEVRYVRYVLELSKSREIEYSSFRESTVFKNCASFTDCIIEINNTEIAHAKDIYVVMPMYKLIEYSEKKLEVYDNTIEMNHLYTIMRILLIFLMIMILLPDDPDTTSL